MGIEVDSEGTLTRTSTLILDITAKNPSLGRMLAEYDEEEQRRRLAKLYVDAYKAGEDEGAFQLLRWYALSEKAYDSVHPGTSAAFHLSYAVSPGEGLWQTFAAMPKTHKELADALAYGLHAKTEEGAGQYLEVLCQNFDKFVNYRPLILQMLKEAMTKNVPRQRLLKFASAERIPEEIRRVLVNGWMRNSGVGSLVHIAGIASNIEACTSEEQDAIHRLTTIIEQCKIRGTVFSIQLVTEDQTLVFLAK